MADDVQLAAAPPAAASEAAKVELRGVWMSYGTKVILQDIDLVVRPREVVSVIGASGSGKTTLLQVIAGLVPCQRGAVIVNGAQITGPGRDRAMVFQDDAVFPWMTVQKNVEFGIRITNLPREEQERRVRQVLELVALTGNEKLYPRQLSGGMRKRVDLARALAVQPDILLMDEPYGALDAMTKERLQIEFLSIVESSQATSLFVTHDLEEALFIGDRVVVLAPNPGRVRAVLDVPFPRARDAALKRSPEFQGLRGELGELI